MWQLFVCLTRETERRLRKEKIYDNSKVRVQQVYKYNDETVKCKIVQSRLHERETRCFMLDHFTFDLKLRVTEKIK